MQAKVYGFRLDPEIALKVKILSIALNKTQKQIVEEMIERTFAENEHLVSRIISRQKLGAEVKKFVRRLSPHRRFD